MNCEDQSDEPKSIIFPGLDTSAHPNEDSVFITVRLNGSILNGKEKGGFVREVLTNLGQVAQGSKRRLPM